MVVVELAGGSCYVGGRGDGGGSDGGGGNVIEEAGDDFMLGEIKGTILIKPFTKQGSPFTIPRP